MPLRSIALTLIMSGLSLVGALVLMAFAMDVVSIPEVSQIKVEYARPYHVHNFNHVADERSAP